jgi:hypothetical protein
MKGRTVTALLFDLHREADFVVQPLCTRHPIGLQRFNGFGTIQPQSSNTCALINRAAAFDLVIPDFSGERKQTLWNNS